MIGRVCGGTSSGRDGRPPRMVKCLLMPRCQRWCVRRTVMDRAAAVTQACGLALRPVCYLKLDVSDAATRGRCTASAVLGRLSVEGANAPAPTASAKMETLRIVVRCSLRLLLVISGPCARCFYTLQGGASVATATANTTQATARSVSRSLRRRMWTCLNEKPGRKSPGPAARGDSSRTTAMP